MPPLPTSQPEQHHHQHESDSVSLRDYIESRLNAIEKSIQVANTAMQIRLDAMNEFRDALKDQAGKFITRTEMDVEISSLREKIRQLELSKAILDGKASQGQAMAATVLSILGILLAIVSLVLKLAGR